MKLLILLILLCLKFVQPQIQRSDVPIWPYPYYYSDTIPGTTVYLNKNQFSFVFKNVQGNIENPDNYPVLKEAIRNRYPNRIFYSWIWQKFNQENQTIPSPIEPFLTHAEILIQNYQTNTVYQGMDESYSLSITNTDRVLHITAPSIWGSINALETMSNLVRMTTFDENIYQIQNTPLNINDRPRFTWRGLMIDTSRHYLKKETILKVIEQMEYAKLNVLHLHLIDAQSFPIVIEKYDQLYLKGAWAPTLIYTKKDLLDIVQYALLRGIRVIPEFDMPGHTYSWSKGYPEVISNCPLLLSNLNNAVLNPLVPKVYDIIQEIFNEMKDIFPDDYFHLGGDEVLYKCWAQDPTISKYVQDNNISYAQFQAIFQNRVEGFMSLISKKMVCWQELALLNTTDYVVSKDSIVQVWRDSNTILAPILQKGYNVILSDGWYLDRQVPVDNQITWLFIDTWKQMYEIDLFGPNTTSTDRRHLLGGEACMWGEAVDQSNIQQSIWPRMAAVAERLWSPYYINDSSLASQRFYNFRCQILRARGILSGPIRPDLCPYVFENPPTKNSNIALELSYWGLGAFALFSGTLILITCISIIVAIYFNFKHQKIKKAWMQDVFSDDNQILKSNHGETLLSNYN